MPGTPTGKRHPRRVRWFPLTAWFATDVASVRGNLVVGARVVFCGVKERRLDLMRRTGLDGRGERRLPGPRAP